MRISLGIPSRGVTSSLYRVVEYALSLDVDEIIVGINPTTDSSEFVNHYGDARLKLFFHNSDLGLYGNFRFLLHQANSPLFAWLCTDDLISKEAISILKGRDHIEANLVLPTWKWVEYNPDQENCFAMDKSIEGVYPCLTNNKALAEAALQCEPSWIFGIWNSIYLKSIFPRTNFDWLDCYILQKTLLSRKVEVLSVSDPTLIGTWNWASKIPNSVNPKGHWPARAILHQLLLAPKILKISPFAWFKIALRMRFLLLLSRSMNQEIKRRRAL